MKSIKLLLLLLLFPLSLYSQSSGTGFLINNSGYIATCNHVIENAKIIYVRGLNNDFSNTYEATIVATDKINDLAIIKVNYTPKSPMSYSFKWTVCEVGQEVFTLGYPLKTTMGEEIKLTNGIISSRSGYQGDISTYQITVPVQPGNSGGPLFDRNGFVVGVINAKLTGAENANYAIKSNFLQNLIQSSSVNITLPQVNSLTGKSLSEQVKLAKKNVLILEVVEDVPTTNIKPIRIKTISEAKIKNKPDVILGDIIGYIPSNSIVEIVGRENEYWKVFYNGKIGYSHEMYFEKSYETLIIQETEKYSKMPPEYQKNNEIATITNQARMRVQPSPISDISENISKGNIVYVVGFADGYWKIYYNGREGYLSDGLYFEVTYNMMRFKK